MPETTPSPKARPKTRSQKSNRRRYTGRPVPSDQASSQQSQAARPTVNAGKMMWNDIVKAN